MPPKYENVTVEVVEQPESQSMRFRYLCEGRSAGSILGVNSTEELKTYPSIRVLNYDGPAVVIVSCVTIDSYRPHPNCLVGKLCSRGVCKFDFVTKAAAPTVVKFPNLGIQCVKRSDILQNLEEREVLRIDPFKTGFEHKLRPKMINLHQIRLCFQVLLKPDHTNPKNLIPLKPVVSNVIRDKHRTNMQLQIHDISDYSSPSCGGKKIMIFCDKIDKRDIRIQFYEEGAGQTVVWEDWAHFKPNDVHKQVAIAFKTPKYKVHEIDRPVNVFFRLQTISDGTISNSIPFQYVPDATNIDVAINTKKRKIDNSTALYEFLQIHEADNCEMSKMKSNIEPNEVYAENIAPDNSNFVASNNHLLPPQSQTYENFQAHGGHYEQQFQQHSNRKQYPQAQKSDYQWPATQPLQPLQLHNVQSQQLQHQKQFEHPRCEQPHFHQPMADSQLKTAPGYENYLSPYNPFSYKSEVGNVYGAAGTLSSNNVSNCGRPSQPLANYQNPMTDTCPIQMTYDAPTHHSCQQMGPVYATDKVIIQQFCNNSITFNQQQNVPLPEIENVSDCLNSDLNLF